MTAESANETTASGNTYLAPVFPMRWRWVLFCMLALPALISGVSWLFKPFAVAMVAFFVGTFRQARIRGGKFQTRMTLMFYPLPPKSCKLASVVAIETQLESQTGWGTYLVFGPVMWIFGKIFDFLLPWIGGEYTLTLRTGKGRRILAWQGNSEENYRENLELLKSATGAEVQRGGW